MAEKNATIHWQSQNKQAVQEAMHLIDIFGKPTSFSGQMYGQMIWEKKSLQKTVFQRIVVRDTDRTVSIPTPQGMRKISACTEVSILFDLPSSPQFEQVIKNLQAPIQYSVPEKLLTALGPSFADCVAILMVVTKCSMPEGCSVKTANEKYSLDNALHAVNQGTKDQQYATMQVFAVQLENNIAAGPGHTIQK